MQARLLFASALGAALTGAPFAHADAYKEAAILTVDTYSNVGGCGTGASDLTYPLADGGFFASAIIADGYPSQYVTGPSNAGVDIEDFTDPTRQSWGLDYVIDQGTDWADVIFFSGHGIKSCATGNYYSASMMGLKVNNRCWPTTGAYTQNGGGPGDMRFGDVDAQIAIFTNCESMAYCVWQHGGYGNGMSQGAFTTINGYHGLSYDTEANSTDYAYYAGYAQYDDVGEDWVDRLTKLDYVNGYDQCATTMIWGTSSTLRDNQFYNGGFMDLKGTGTPTSATSYYYISGCDPDGDSSL